MQTLPLQTVYPVPYFLYDALANPKTLRALLNTPKNPKVKKARLVGYKKTASQNGSTVRLATYNFGEWMKEDEVKGWVYMVVDAQEERILREYVGGGFRVEAAEIEVLGSGVFGMVGFGLGKKRVVGRVFVRAGAGQVEGEGVARTVEGGRGWASPSEVDLRGRGAVEDVERPNTRFGRGDGILGLDDALLKLQPNTSESSSGFPRGEGTRQALDDALERLEPHNLPPASTASARHPIETIPADTPIKHVANENDDSSRQLDTVLYQDEVSRGLEVGVPENIEEQGEREKGTDASHDDSTTMTEEARDHTQYTHAHDPTTRTTTSNPV